MCGIAGAITSANAEKAMGRALACLSHRGPDESVFRRLEPDSGSSVFLGMTRLSIVDVRNGHQPYSSEDQQTLVVFNGEIYNYGELRLDLIAKGHTFSSLADGEVIPHLFEEYGFDFPKHLEGMFAIALYDKSSNSAVLVRDRFGEKPLYFTQRGRELYFASQLRALEALSSDGLGSVSRQSVTNLLTYGFVPGGQSIYEGVHKVEPGTSLTFRDGALTKQIWWEPTYSMRTGAPLGSRENREKAIESSLQASVARRIPSEVPFGLFLSGGIDSSLVASFASELSESRLSAYTVRFDDKSLDESSTAQTTARRLGVDLNIIDFPSDYSLLWERFMTVFDEPNLDSSAFPMLVISEAASQDVKVALSGDGGDELFGGYPKYISAHSLSWLSRTLSVPEPKFNFSSDRARRYASILASATRGPVSLSNVLNEQYFYNWENPIGTPWIPRSDHENRLKISGKARWLDLDLQGYLPGILQKVDLASMGSSLEVRSPFFNVELYELARSLRDHDLFSLRQTKSLLRSIAKKRLGSQVSSLPKSGFSPHRGRILDWAIREKGLVFGSGFSQIEQAFDLKLPENYSPNLLGLRPASDRKIWALMVLEDWLSRR